MSRKVAKSIGLLYNLNRFLLETILKMLYISIIHPYLAYGEHIKIIPLKFLFS